MEQPDVDNVPGGEKMSQETEFRILSPGSFLSGENCSEEMGVGETAVVPTLTDNDEVHGGHDEHSLVAGADRRNHVSRRLPA
jgi:hypothetical protein